MRLWRSRVSRQFGCRKIRSQPSADLPGGDLLGKFVLVDRAPSKPVILQGQKFILFALFTDFYRHLLG